jgi:hypothetical protein
MVFDVRSGLRRPQRPTVPAIAGAAPAVVFCALRAARANVSSRDGARCTAGNLAEILTIGIIPSTLHMCVEFSVRLISEQHLREQGRTKAV